MMKVSSYFLFLGKYSMNKERTIINTKSFNNLDNQLIF